MAWIIKTLAGETYWKEFTTLVGPGQPYLTQTVLFDNISGIQEVVNEHLVPEVQSNITDLYGVRDPTVSKWEVG